MKLEEGTVQSEALLAEEIVKLVVISIGHYDRAVVELAEDFQFGQEAGADSL